MQRCMPKEDITGVILAGGRAQRMGGIDKGLIELEGKPMIAYVMERLAPQVSRVVINANRNLDVYRRWAQTVVKDVTDGYDGPLAGMASGLKVVETQYMLTCPCDSPLVANDLAERMYNQAVAKKTDIAVASDGVRLHPVFLLIRHNLLPSILKYLDAGERKIDKWFEQHAFTIVDFSDEAETFINVNTLEQKEDLSSRLDVDV